MPLENPSDDTCAITASVLYGLKRIYRSGFAYKKAGVMLMQLTQKENHQSNLFDDGTARIRSEKLMQAMDAINMTWGRNTLRVGSMGTTRRWAMRSENRSPRYTTAWEELPDVK